MSDIVLDALRVIADRLSGIEETQRRIEGKQDALAGSIELQKHALASCAERVEELRDHVIKHADHTGREIARLERKQSSPGFPAVKVNGDGSNGSGHTDAE